MKFTRECDYCYNEYKADSSELNRGRGLTCSHKCASHLKDRLKKHNGNVQHKTAGKEKQKLAIFIESLECN